MTQRLLPLSLTSAKLASEGLVSVECRMPFSLMPPTLVTVVRALVLVSVSISALVAWPYLIHRMLPGVVSLNAEMYLAT